MKPEHSWTPSISADPRLASSVIRLLELVESTPSGVAGALRFGEHGAILVDNRKICWAFARDMRFGLTELLQNQYEPALPRADIEGVYRRCRQEGRPITEGLLEHGLTSELGLRRALSKHHGEAIAQLARTFTTPSDFAPSRPGYDVRYSFTAAEMLALSGANVDPSRAARAQSELATHLVDETTGAAFVRSQASSGALVIAVAPHCQLPLVDLLDVLKRATSLFDVADVFDPGISLLRAACCERTALVAWRDQGVCYAGLCASRAATARLMSSLSERLTAPAFAYAEPPRQKGAARP